MRSLSRSRHKVLRDALHFLIMVLNLKILRSLKSSKICEYAYEKGPLVAV